MAMFFFGGPRRSRIRLSALAGLAAAGAIAMTTFAAAVLVAEDGRRQQLALEETALAAMSRDTAELTVLTRMYALQPQPEVGRQWAALQRRLMSVIDSLPAETATELADDMDRWRQAARQLEGLFESHASTLSPLAPPDELVQNRTNRLLEALGTQAAGLHADVSAARQALKARQDRLASAYQAALLAFAGVAAAALAFLAWVLHRRVMYPLARLRHRLRSHDAGLAPAASDGAAGRDEFGALAADINHLTRAWSSRCDSWRAAAEAAEQAGTARATFLAHVSHEIRTPLTSVLSTVHALDTLEMPETQRRLVGTLNTASGSLKRLLDDFLDLAKIEAGGMTLETAPLSLESLVWETVGLHEHEARQRGLELVVEVDRGLPPWVLGDRVRLGQVLGNLLSNALRFTERGAVLVHARSADGGAANRWCLTVEDSGIGFDAHVKERLFRPFMQADASTARRYGGTGLGLSITHDLVRLMGGNIQVSSVPGMGSCFTVSLPLEPCAAPAMDHPPKRRGRSEATPPIVADHATASLPRPSDASDERALAASESRGSAPPLARPLDGMRLLVVDDCTTNLEAVSWILRAAGAVVAVASEAEGAVVRLKRAAGRGRQHAFDLVLMDVQMPGMDGHEAARRIRLDPRLARLPVLALSGGDLPSERDSALAAGMDDYIRKPFDPAGLVSAVRTHVERARSRGEALHEQTDLRRDPEPASNDSCWPAGDAAGLAEAGLGTGLSLDLSERLMRELRDHAAELAHDDGRDRSALARRLHQLAGTAGLLGEQALSSAALRAEQQLREGLPGAHRAVERVRAHLAEVNKSTRGRRRANSAVM
jgi:signal transduction histidine kinase/DNA-binding NarL/FixJ family response regulator/HPt (histidine-containing phosphotransfer) domain-containing protein